MFEVIRTCHGQPGLQLMEDAPVAAHELLRQATVTNWMKDPFYQLKKDAGAFLQGQNYDEVPSWTLVEFWLDDYQPFVDALNQEWEKIK